MQDYNTTFGRLFGGEREASPAHREEFGVGFRRAQATYSPPPRTRCVQDIILRDKTGATADMPAKPRATPTFKVTTTTHQDLSPKKPAVAWRRSSFLDNVEPADDTSSLQRDEQQPQRLPPAPPLAAPRAGSPRSAGSPRGGSKTSTSSRPGRSPERQPRHLVSHMGFVFDAPAEDGCPRSPRKRSLSGHRPHLESHISFDAPRLSPRSISPTFRSSLPGMAHRPSASPRSLGFPKEGQSWADIATPQRRHFPAQVAVTESVADLAGRGEEPRKIVDDKLVDDHLGLRASKEDASAAGARMGTLRDSRYRSREVALLHQREKNRMRWR
eukprot:TRINITY_DN3759_c0_g6_i2.p1 TRINITY_DN3759_c0_g6~~TRINITY_DN3759_c0_g6_i2.p1  ORF type:complete len:374 (+),score=47.77 TRINITY_DN3759_c0_g6_i2:141-1124(+)